VVQDKLQVEWSPEQIASYLRITFPDRPAWHVCHETSYQPLYQGKGGLSRQLARRPRTGAGQPFGDRHARTPAHVLAEAMDHEHANVAMIV